MTSPRRRFGRLLLGGAAAGLGQSLAGPAFGQAWPNKPIRLILPFGPGSGTDTLARTVVEPMSRALKQNFVIEHRPGANTAIACSMVAKAAPDGYTLGLLTNSGLAANPGGLMDNPGYDVARELVFASLVASVHYVLLAAPGLPARTARELIEHVKANPGKFSYASGNTGGISYGGYVARHYGLDIAHIQYKSTPPALVDLAAGHVHLMVSDVPAAMPMIRGGRFQVVAVPQAQRHPLLPDVPTFVEQGLAQPPDFSGWWMLTAPAGTPTEILDRLNAEVTAALNNPEVRASLSRAGLVPTPSTRDEALRYQRDQLQVWGRMIRELGLRI
jgi:tripartite-type tricarboxylate transporter receptor subunit TctC